MSKLTVDVIAKLNKQLSKSSMKGDLKSLDNTLYVRVLAKLSKTLASRELKRQIKELDNLNVNVGTKIKTNKSTEAELKKNIKSLQKTVSDLEIGLDTSKFSKELRGIKQEMQQKIDTSQLQNFNKELKNSESAAQSAEGKWRQLATRFKDFLSSSNMSKEILAQIRQAINTAIDLDKTYTGLMKSNNELSRGDYADYLSRCNRQAQELATSQKTLMEGTAEFSKLGFNLNTSEKLTEKSVMLSNIGDMSLADSSKAIAAGVNAYGMVDGHSDATQKAQALIDKYAELGNTSSITTAELARGVQSVGSAFADTNTSVDEFLALLSAGNEQYQNAEGLASALGVSALRIRGASDELALAGENVDDVMSAIDNQKAIKALTGVDILENDQKTIRSIYDIFLDISKVYQDMSVEDQGTLLDILGGKNQTAAISTALNSMTEAQSLLQNSLHASGAAQKEYETYLESTEAHLQQFQSKLVETYSGFVNGDMVSHAAEFGVLLLDIINKTDILKHSLIAIATVKIGQEMATFGDAIVGTITQMNTLGNALQQVKSLPSDSESLENVLKDIGTETKDLTDKNLKLLLSQTQLDEANRISILKMRDLSEKEAIAKLEQLGLTSATKANTTANTANAASVNVLKGTFTGLTTSIKATWAAMSMLEKASLIFAAISTAYSIVSSIVSNHNQEMEELLQKTRDAANVYKDTSSSIDDYIVRYQALQQALQDAKGNEEETYNIKKQLLDLQTELNDKFGDEYGIVNLVTDAYEDQTEALKALNKETANKFLNENRDGIKTATKEMEKDQTYSLGGLYSFVAPGEDVILEEIKRLAASNDIDFTNSGFEFVGNAAEAHTAINNFMNDIRALKDASQGVSGEMSNIFEGILDESSDALNQTDDIIEEYGQIYEQAKLAQIATNTNLSDGYDKAVAAVEAYNEAVLKSENPYQDENVKIAWDALQEERKQIQQNQNMWGEYSTILDNVFSSANDKVYSFYQKLQNDANISALADNLKGLTDVDLEVMYADKTNKDPFETLCEHAREYGLEMQDVIDLLIKLGYVQGQVKPSTNPLSSSNSVNDVNAASKEQADAIDDQMGGNNYLENYGGLLDSIKSDESHGIGNGMGNTDMTEEAMDSLIEKNQELNQSLMDGKISTADYFNDLSESITNSGLEEALDSLDGQFDDTTDYLEETVSVLGAELSDAMLQSNKRFMKGETSVGDYAEELKSGAKAQQKLLKSTYGLTIGQDGYAEAMEGADEATQDAIDSYNNLVDAQEELNSVDSFISTLSDNADFLSSYTDEAGNLMDSVMDDSRFSRYVSSLSQDLVAFAGSSTDNMNLVAQALADAAGIGVDEAMTLLQSGAGAVETAVGGSLGSLQGMTNFAMGTVGNSINNTSSAIGSVLSSLGNAISGFDFKIEAKPYITGGFSLKTDEHGIPNGLNLPTFGFDITGSGGASVTQFADALANAGSYFSNSGAAQAGANAQNISSYLPSGSGKGSTAAGTRPSTTPDSPRTTAPRGSGGSSGGSGSASEAAKETVETFDWIENKMESMERHIKRLDQTVGQTYKGWSERNTALTQEFEAVCGKFWTEIFAYQKYMQMADESGLSDHYKNLVQNGDVAIEDISDETLKEQISTYEKWYKKAKECEEEMEDLKETLADLSKTSFEHATQAFEDQISVLEHTMDMLDAFIDQAEAREHFARTAYYDGLIQTEEERISLLREEYDALTDSLAKAVKDGGIEKYSEEWYDMYNAILDVDKAITEATTSLYEHQSALRELKWDYFETQQTYVSKLTEEADWLIGLMEKQGKLIFDLESLGYQFDTLSSRGIAVKGLHAMNYNVYMAQADEYAREIQKINEQMAKDPYNTILIEKRDELLEAQRDNIDAAYDEIDAVKDLMSEAQQKQLDMLQELIDKRKEALRAERDLYDYQKTIAEKTSNIASLEKQMNAYAGDDSEETTAKLQQLKLELDEARTDLEETEYEKWLSDQERLMDDLYTEYEVMFNQRLDNVEYVLNDMLESANLNAEDIRDTLSATADSVGTTLSTEMKRIWESGNGPNSIVARYGDNMVSGLTSVGLTLESIKNFVESMATKADEKAAAEVKAQTEKQQAAANKVVTPATANASASDTQTLNLAASNTAGAGDSSFFVYKKDSFPKNKLNIESSIVDRLKYHDYDSGFAQRARYYTAMGFSGTYTASASQNIQMLNWMKSHGLHKGGEIGGLIRQSGETGFALVKTGETIITDESTKSLRAVMETLEKNGMNGLPDVSRCYASELERIKRIEDKLWDMPLGYEANVTNAPTSNITLEIDNLTLPNVKNYEEFKTALLSDSHFEKVMGQAMSDQMLGRNPFNKFRYL